MKKLISGAEAVKLAAGGVPSEMTGNGLLLFPDLSTKRKHALSGYSLETAEFLPSTPEEALEMTRSAAVYAGTYGMPVLVRLSDGILKTVTGIELSALEKTEFNRGRCRTSSGKTDERADIGPDRRKPFLSRAASDSRWNRVSGKGKKAVLTGGTGWSAVTDILNGWSGVRVVKIGILRPFPEEAVLSFLAGAEEVSVIGEAGQELIGMLYMLKGKYNLNFRIHPFSRENETVSGIRETLTGLAGRAAAEIFLRTEPVAERSLMCMPILPARTGPTAMTFPSEPAVPADEDFLAEVI